MRVYIGVDWSATELVCALCSDNGAPSPVRLRAAPFLDSVIALLAHIKERYAATELFVLIEAGAPLWVWLLHTAGATVFVVDPKQAKRFAQSQSSSGAKDDPRDAASLADMCRSPAHRKSPFTPDSQALQRLDVLGLAHEQLTTDLVRAKQRLRDHLRKQMPLVDKALPRDLCATWVSVFLRKVSTPWQLSSLTYADLEALMPHTRKATRKTMWEALQQSQAPWLTQALANTISQQVCGLLDQMALLRTQLDRVEAEMDEVLDDFPVRPLLESMSGIGPRLTAAIIQYALRDSPPKDRDSASIQMGASPVFSGSGRRKDGKPKGTAHMRRAAAARARRSSYLIGRLGSQHLSWGKAMYKDAMERGQTSAAAYRRVARSVLRIVTLMSRSGQSYDDARYVGQLKKKGVSWAMSL